MVEQEVCTGICAVADLKNLAADSNVLEHGSVTSDEEEFLMLNAPRMMRSLSGDI